MKVRSKTRKLGIRGIIRSPCSVLRHLRSRALLINRTPHALMTGIRGVGVSTTGRSAKSCCLASFLYCLLSLHL